MWKDSTASMVLNGLEQTSKLEKELSEGTYVPRPVKHFDIYYPKKREIASIAFRDRVYQRSLNDLVLYPQMTRHFIYDNWACQKGKGTDGARNRIKQFLREYHRRYGSKGYVLQLDIKGYYPNMSHDVVEQVFAARLPEDACIRALQVLRYQYDGDKGYNPGSQMIQIAGISVLDGFDHYCKEQLHIHYYLRYMDDIICIFRTREEADKALDAANEYLTGLKFQLSRKKTKIYTLQNGIPFLGFDLRLTDTGKVLMFVRNENIKAQRRKLRRLVAKSKRGEVPKESVDESYRCWRNHASKGNSYRLLQRMDEFYRRLWTDV